MKILHRHVLVQLIKNFLYCLMVFVFLFLIFDFFDHIDNIVAENASVLSAIQYFLLKIPLTLTLMLPVASMVGTLLTIGLLSKSSEITAMRASGVSVRWIAYPLFTFGVAVSLISILLNETLVPYSQRRSREVYNIDIKQKDVKGGFSQSDFWWRNQNRFYSVGMFDSRTNTLHEVSSFKLSDDFTMSERTESNKATWVDPLLGWTMHQVSQYQFDTKAELQVERYKSLPLPLREQPTDFYDVKTDPATMSYRQMRSFVKQQGRNGLDISGYLPYLYEKLASPFLNFIIILVVLPFALKPARSGSMATSIIAGMLIGFSYYAVHSFSIAMGKAEILPPLFSAWLANVLMGFVGLILMLGAEAPE